MGCGRILIPTMARRRYFPVVSNLLRRRRRRRRVLRRRGNPAAEVLVVGINGVGGGGGVLGLGGGIADEGVEALEVRPRGDVAAVGLDNLGLLDLVLLLGGVDAVLALDVGAAELGGGGVDGVGDLLPVLLPEVPAVEMDVVGPPRLNQSPGSFLRPAVLATGENGGPRLRRQFRREVGFRG